MTNFAEHIPAERLTTMKCGGTVRYFAQPKTLEELHEALTEAKSLGLVSILGGGSNRIFPDDEFPGVVIQPLLTEITLVELPELSNVRAEGRYLAEGEQFLRLQEGQIASGEKRGVEMGAGVPWGQAVTWSISHNLAGLEHYARIPCRVGGAVYNNIHAAQHLLSEQIAGVWALNPETLEEVFYTGEDLAFGYDQSRFHTSNEIITKVVFALTEVSAEISKNNLSQYLAWTAEKGRVQPTGPNSGSVFQNLRPEEAAAIGETALAAGWYVDQCGFKGESVGGMQVYPGHGNFIVNTGGGTQADFIALVIKIRAAVYARWGLNLQPEVQCLQADGKDFAWPTNHSA